MLYPALQNIHSLGFSSHQLSLTAVGRNSGADSAQALKHGLYRGSAAQGWGGGITQLLVQYCRAYRVIRIAVCFPARFVTYCDFPHPFPVPLSLQLPNTL